MERRSRGAVVSDELHVCIDRLEWPSDALARLALQKQWQWPRRGQVRIAFLDGDPSLRAKVETVGGKWLDHACLTFFFIKDPMHADVRIAFEPGAGSWSTVGTDCKNVAPPAPTMNFGWLTPTSPDLEIQRVVLHEFGHMLGCIHEHQHPSTAIDWDKPAVYAYYAERGWDKAKVDRNVFDLYSSAMTNSTARPDPTSIMMYPIPAELLRSGQPVDWNLSLSEADKAFIKGMYP
jgi:hypothetical protein